jgi:hypothetical protein
MEYEIEDSLTYNHDTNTTDPSNPDNYDFN